MNGSKTRWALIIAINFFGPLAYFRVGDDTAGVLSRFGPRSWAVHVPGSGPKESLRRSHPYNGSRR